MLYWHKRTNTDAEGVPEKGFPRQEKAEAMVKEAKKEAKEEARVSSIFGYVSPTKLFGRKDAGAGKEDGKAGVLKEGEAGSTSAAHTLAAADLPSAASK